LAGDWEGEGVGVRGGGVSGVFRQSSVQPLLCALRILIVGSSFKIFSLSAIEF
jgi:hypothetical protein